MKPFRRAAPLFLALSVAALAGCDDVAWQIDPFAMNPRDGSAKPVDYPALMRIGAAAHAGGDNATALGLYRRAATLDPRATAPFVAIGNTLIEMGQVNEAIVAYNSALARSPTDPEALRGLARAYLMTGKTELAGQPLSTAFKQTPDDPKLLQLIGVADDFAGQHEEAQARYRRGLELLPRDPGLSLNLALSLALTGNYREAVSILAPIAMSPTASARERQTLALIYGLEGDTAGAERLARMDLDAHSVQRNLAYYESLRRLAPDARARAIQSLTTRRDTTRPS
jgi:Flp pilus assembly protein TadD